MPIQLIQKYYAEIDRIIRYGGTCSMSKQSVIELLMRVCTVSAETMKIVEEMPE